MNTSTYALKAARNFIASMEHYGNTSPAVGDGRMGTPAYYATMLGNAAIARDEVPTGSGWWGNVWLAYAQKLVAELGDN